MTEGIFFRQEMVNLNSLEVSGVDKIDYPEFCDAYFCTGKLQGGSDLTDEELDTLTDLLPAKVNEMAHDMYLELALVYG